MGLKNHRDGKNDLRYRLFSLSYQMAIAIIASTLFLAASASAADDSSINIQSSASSSSPPSDANTKCRKSTLTEEEFLEMVKKIALHGDITDIPFIEKTLKVKINPRKTMDYRRMYSTLYGSPIAIFADFDSQLLDQNIHKEFGKSGSLNFQIWASNFHDCGNLITEQFDRKFFSLSPIHYSSAIITGGWKLGMKKGGIKLGNSGKNGTSMEVEYEYRSKDNVIVQILIAQRDSTFQPKQ